MLEKNSRAVEPSSSIINHACFRGACRFRAFKEEKANRI
jgi:hypothetical protein